MVDILELYIEDLWDERHWSVAVKGDKPVEIYSSIKSEIADQKNSKNIDELPPAERDWYRSTG